MDGGTSDERLIIVVLACISGICLAGIVLLRALRVDGSDEALVTIASLAVGALASRISQKDKATGDDDHTQVVVRDQARGPESLDDDFAVIGRAATKQIIAEAMRTMGGTSSYLRPDEPT